MATSDEHPRPQSREMDETAAENSAAQYVDVRTDAPATLATSELRRINRYQIRRLLGKGAFGEVYEALDESLNRVVAIKVLTRLRATSNSDKWLNEARTLAKLDHVGIVPVYDVGRTENEIPYIVSKYIGGGNLAELLHQGAITISRAIRIGISVAEALGYAHERGFFHRDVKPANVLLTTDGEPVLADFGLALHEADFGTGDCFVGTPAYMSPEQARMEAHRVDGRCDVYSLGVVLYEMLTGKRPFHGVTTEAVLDCIRAADVRPPRQLNREVSRELDRVCLKTLAKRASDRYSTALDLADDLRNCLPELHERESNRAQETGDQVRATPGSNSRHSAESQAVAIRPRGLRSFDATDADFFPLLLPGPRDREGVPESIRFWQRRIEERDPQKTFRIGVLLGPSGSGKSSLVRAGVIPHLDSTITTVVAEARADQFESHLLKRLQYSLPALSRFTTLRDAITSVRQRRELAPNQKLLLVIDQFEQYLNRPFESQADGLLDALRQCDGETVQALLLVRDEFTLVLARFMDALEEPLLQNHNFATVDRFGAEHARQVLISFGRAYGTLGEELRVDQEKFVESAVRELAVDGPLIPVQLALFADIVKDREWVPATLIALGGARGVGIKFLEERIVGPSANPSVRIHHRLIQRLLAELLPADGELIKARAQTQTQLVARTSDLADAETVSRTLALLDSELRLVSPRGLRTAEESSTAASNSESTSREPAYQLTHDFMVPAIRAWLEGEQRATRVGRARVRLRDLAQSWHVRPEPRRLPSLGEWLSIRWLTSPQSWTLKESEMMQVAARRLQRITATTLIVCLVSVLLGYQVFGRWQARILCERLLTVDTAEIDEVVAEMQPRWRWVEPQLRTIIQQNVATDQDARSRRRRLNLALALAAEDRAALETVIEQLSPVPPEHLPAVQRVLARPPNQAIPLLWSAFKARLANQNEELLPSGALPIGALLVGLDPSNEAWRTHAAHVAELLASARATQVAQWGRLYEPIASQLTPRLMEMYQKHDSDSAERTNLVELLNLFTETDPSQRTTVISHSQLPEIPFLIAASANSSELINSLRKQLLAAEAARLHSDIEPASVPETLQQTIQQAGGSIDGNCAWVTSLAFTSFDSLDRSLVADGYAARCLRPYVRGKQSFVAAIWRRDQRETHIDWNITTDQVREQVVQRAAQGWTPVDFSLADDAGYTAQEGKWNLVWQLSPAKEREVLAYFDLPYSEHQQKEEELSKQGFAQIRFEIRIPMDKHPLYSAIWRRIASSDTKSFGMWRYAGAFGDRYPGRVQSDIRRHWLGRASDRLNLLEQHLESHNITTSADTSPQKRDEATRTAANEQLKAVSRLLSMGQRSEAKAILSTLITQWPQTFRIYELLAEVHFWAGDEAALSAVIDQSRNVQKIVSIAVEEMELKAAVLREDLPTCEKKLGVLETAAQENTEGLERYVRVLAMISQRSELASIAENSRNKLYVNLRRYLTSMEAVNPYQLLDGVEFDGLRSDPGMVELSRELGIEQRVSATYFENAAIESRLLHGLSPTAHQQQATELRNAGFVPVTLNRLETSESEEAICDSVWQRSVLASADRLAETRTISRLVLALAHAREFDVLFDALQDRWGRDVRTTMITNAALLVPVQPLIDRLLQESSAPPGWKRNLLLTLGGYPASRVTAQQHALLSPRLLSWSSSPADAGFRAAAEWCAKQWGYADASASSPSRRNATDDDRAWVQNSLGQIMVAIQPVDKFLMGSPAWESGRESEEALHWARINRNYAISATEVTVAQFREFLNDPRVKPYYRESELEKLLAESGDGTEPQTGATWLDARRFCEWLSEREGAPESQRCYVDVWAKLEMQAIPPRDYLSRSGYRLPTEMEWEYAARAGSRETFHCGTDEELLISFEWINRNAKGTKHPSGLLRPNDWGLFDTLGNVSEWCDDKIQRYDVPITSFLRVDRSTFQIGDRLENLKPNVRGGHFGASPGNSRSAKRISQPATPGSRFIGFRVARTLKD